MTARRAPRSERRSGEKQPGRSPTWWCHRAASGLHGKVETYHADATTDDRLGVKEALLALRGLAPA